MHDQVGDDVVRAQERARERQLPRGRIHRPHADRCRIHDQISFLHGFHGRNPADVTGQCHGRLGFLGGAIDDRDLSRTAVDVDLGGSPARMPSGPARLAQRTGADLVPVTLAYRGDDLEITFHEPVDPGTGEDGVAAATRQVAHAFSRGLVADTADWHMMQRVFT